MLTADRGASGAKAPTQKSANQLRDAEVTTVNMHRLGESFVEKVIDVRRRVTADVKATAPGESLEFWRSFKGDSRRPEGRDGSDCCN